MGVSLGEQIFKPQRCWRMIVVFRISLHIVPGKGIGKGVILIPLSFIIPPFKITTIIIVITAVTIFIDILLLLLLVIIILKPITVGVTSFVSSKKTFIRQLAATEDK